MSYFMNRRDAIVAEAIDGFLLTSPPGDLARLDGFPDVKVVVRANWDRSKVAIVSGGGSGHEPAHAGFVGRGALTAAVCGDIFASPTVHAVYSRDRRRHRSERLPADRQELCRRSPEFWPCGGTRAR